MEWKADLSTQQRNQIIQFILESCIDGKPAHGKLVEAQQKFAISKTTVRRLWAAAKKQQEKGEAIHLASRKGTNVQKRVTVDLERLSSLEYSKRTTIRKLAVALGQSKSTVGRWVQAGKIRSHTSSIKPDLTATNKMLRLKFCLQSLELDRIQNQIKFKSMHNTVHIDEKWFYITRGSQRYYLSPGEAEPHRTCQNKKFLTKVMFMCAVCRPIFSDDGQVLFDGKIGIYPFTKQVPAKRRSKNREAGTLETKAIDSITKDVIKECLISKIIPAIKSKWPNGASKDIYIQQDNARPHIKDDDPDFRAEASGEGFNIRLVQQPLNSPDCNVNDLGWFRAIQSIQVETSCKTIEELVNAVLESFEKLSPITLNNVFLSLQGCLLEIMKVKGQNSYKIPHMGKQALRRSDQLPITLDVSVELIRECINYLIEMGSSEDTTEIMISLGLGPCEQG